MSTPNGKETLDKDGHPTQFTSVEKLIMNDIVTG